MVRFIRVWSAARPVLLLALMPAPVFSVRQYFLPVNIVPLCLPGTSALVVGTPAQAGVVCGL